MIGNGYWSVGIIVFEQDGAWTAKAEFHDDGFLKGDADTGQVSTEGVVECRYMIKDGARVSGLAAVVDAVKADVERLGITWRPGVTIFYDASKEDHAPAGWRVMVNAQAVRLGWEPYYSGA